ncbi:MAG: DUF2794 domain-containing protein [Alphaproteobacteria bacterium]
MAEVLPIQQSGTTQSRGRLPLPIFFDRTELNQILSVYSRRVIAGEWCDYALNDGRDEAMFAIYRKRSRVPVFRVVKRRSGKARFAVLDSGGQVLRMSPDLTTVLGVLKKARGLRLV